MVELQVKLAQVKQLFCNLGVIVEYFAKIQTIFNHFSEKVCISDQNYFYRQNCHPQKKLVSYKKEKKIIARIYYSVSFLHNL